MSDSLRNYPGLYLSRLDNALSELQAAFLEVGTDDVMNDHLEIACAQRLALETAALYADDERAFREGDPDFQVMNLRELEETLAIARRRLEAAVAKAREMDSLKQMAENLLNHVNRVRLEREKMVKVTLDNFLPLHLVCLKYGLPITFAERLFQINRIRHPNFTEGEVLVYAR